MPETTVRGSCGRSPLAVVVAIAGIAASGCGDATGAAPAVLMTEETRAAVGLGLDLPSFPALIDEAVAAVHAAAEEATGSRAAATTIARPGSPPAPRPDSLRSRRSVDPRPAASLREEAGRWEATWLMDPAAGREARGRIYDRAAAPVAEAVGRDAVRTSLERVERAVRAIEETDLPGLPPGYRARVDEARRLAGWGHAVLDEGDASEALRAALEAADRVREINPRRVATTLLERARRARAGADDGSGGNALDRERIDRLVRGAETALERGEYPLAIRRAYYACRLLGLPVS